MRGEVRREMKRRWNKQKKMEEKEAKVMKLNDRSLRSDEGVPP